jgi:GAF domain-containing protein
VLSCDRSSENAFTIFDRDLLEEIAIWIAPLLEKTWIIGTSNKIISDMARLVQEPDSIDKLLSSICEYAVNAAEGKAASVSILGKAYSPVDPNDLHKTIQELNKDDIVRHYCYPRAKSSINAITPEQVVESENCQRIDSEQHEIRTNNSDIETYELSRPWAPLEPSPNQSLKQRIGFMTICRGERALSSVQRSMLELLARHSATAITAHEFITQNHYMKKAHDAYSIAVNEIYSTDNLSGLLHKVARQIYQLTKDDLITAWSSGSGGKANMHTPQLLSIVMLEDASSGNLAVQSVWPSSEFIEVEEALNNLNASESQMSCLKKYFSEARPIDENYLLFHKDPVTDMLINVSSSHVIRNSNDTPIISGMNKDSRSILIVPIFRRNSTSRTNISIYVGMLRLEFTDAPAFSSVHIRVLRQFAAHLETAVEKLEADDWNSRTSKIMTSLYNSLSQIACESSETMLYRAAKQTEKELSALLVVIRLYTLDLSNDPSLAQCSQQTVDEVPSLSEKQSNLLNEDTMKVLESEEPAVVRFSISDSSVKEAFVNDLLLYSTKGNLIGVCLPFSTGGENAEDRGVMWIIGSRDLELDPRETFADARLSYCSHYARQIANAYSLKKRLRSLTIEERGKIDSQLEEYRKMASFSSRSHSFLSIVATLIGLTLVGVSVWTAATNKDTKNQVLSGLIGLFGVSAAAITSIVYSRSDIANKRLDGYYESLNKVSNMNLLMGSADQLGSDNAIRVKEALINKAAAFWLTDSSGKVSLSKNGVDSTLGSPENQ